jgi:hypothetical protein
VVKWSKLEDYPRVDYKDVMIVMTAQGAEDGNTTLEILMSVRMEEEAAVSDVRERERERERGAREILGSYEKMDVERHNIETEKDVERLKGQN